MQHREFAAAALQAVQVDPRIELIYRFTRAARTALDGLTINADISRCGASVPAGHRGFILDPCTSDKRPAIFVLADYLIDVFAGELLVVSASTTYRAPAPGD